MKVRKAVITAAGRGTRLYPVADTVQKAMLPLVDRDGLVKPVIQIIAEEALASGIEELCVVCAPGDEAHYLRQFSALRENLLSAYNGIDWAVEQAHRIDHILESIHFAAQSEPLGYGHAVYSAKAFCGDEPFLLLLGDHLYLSHEAEKRCAQQLIECAVQNNSAVAAVQATREHVIGNYGTVTGKHLPNQRGVYRVERIIEKPSLCIAEIELLTPGLRAGHYLCFFGMHVLTPVIFDLLSEQIALTDVAHTEVQLTPAMQELARRDTLYALDVHGIRYDIGQQYGLLRAQLALGIAGGQRDLVLTLLNEQMLELHQTLH